MSAGLPLLEARNVARRHPDGPGWLLDHVSLEIRAGARLSISGPSGSGKTLLLRALALLDPLDEGDVTWQGRPVRGNEVPDFRRRVVYLHQRPALIGATVEAALRRPFSLRVHHRRQFDRDRIVAWLEELGRDVSFLGKPVGELSGGESQIAALLRALQLDPAVLLLDEPTAALDPPTVAAVEGLLRNWVEEQSGERATVWVTHHAGQAARVGERIVRIENGRIANASGIP